MGKIITDYEKDFLERWRPVIEALNKTLELQELSEYRINDIDIIRMSDDQKVKFIWCINAAVYNKISFFDAAMNMGLTHVEIFGTHSLYGRKAARELKPSYIRKQTKRKGMKVTEENMAENKDLIKLKRKINETITSRNH